jgi:hypothetical protein
MKNFILSFFRSQPITHEPSTVHAEDEIIRNRCMYSEQHRTVTSVAHSVTVQEAGLQGCRAVWLGDFFTTFRRNRPPSSSGLRVSSRTYSPEGTDGTVSSFELWGKKLPNQTARQASTVACFHNTKTRWQL